MLRLKSIIEKLRGMRGAKPVEPEPPARDLLRRLREASAQIEAASHDGPKGDQALARLRDTAPCGAARALVDDALDTETRRTVANIPLLRLVDDRQRKETEWRFENGRWVLRSIALLTKRFPQTARRFADVVENELDLADDRRTLEEAHPNFFREFWDLRAHIKFDGANFRLVDRETAGDLSDSRINAAHQRAGDLCRRLLDFHPRHLASLRTRFAVFSTAVAWKPSSFDIASSETHHATSPRPCADEERPRADVFQPRTDEGSGP